jgi:hypothetical protein
LMCNGEGPGCYAVLECRSGVLVVIGLEGPHCYVEGGVDAPVETGTDAAADASIDSAGDSPLDASADAMNDGGAD